MQVINGCQRHALEAKAAVEVMHLTDDAPRRVGGATREGERLADVLTSRIGERIADDDRLLLARIEPAPGEQRVMIELRILLHTGQQYLAPRRLHLILLETLDTRHIRHGQQLRANLIVGQCLGANIGVVVVLAEELREERVD